MKKIVTILVLVLVQVAFSKASIRLVDLNGNDVTNGVYSDVCDTSSTDPYEYDLDVINNSANTISISCSRVENSIVALSESYFCWDVCYTPTVNNSLTSISVNALDTISGFFHAYFLSNYQLGTSTMRYKLTNTADPNDTASITIILYAGTVGIKSTTLASKNKIGAAYPNPASGITSINYAVESSVAASLKITNEIGQEVYTQQIETNKGTIRINSAKLQPGVYFYSLCIGDAKVSTKKLIITQ